MSTANHDFRQPPLFTLVRKPSCKQGLLGYERIEVIGTRPWAIDKRSMANGGELGKWADSRICCLFMCLVEHEGAMTYQEITDSDFLLAINQYGEYDVLRSSPPVGAQNSKRRRSA